MPPLADRFLGVATPILRLLGVPPPNQPKTKKHGVRVPEDLWQAALEKAHRRGETITDVILRALKAYLRD